MVVGGRDSAGAWRLEMSLSQHLQVELLLWSAPLRCLDSVQGLGGITK